MTKSARTTFLLLIAVLAVAFVSLPAVATEGEEPAPAESEEETVVTTDIVPAVEVTVPESEATTADWTYRYLVPTGIVLAVLVIISTSAQYFTNVVRKRYRIVEE